MSISSIVNPSAQNHLVTAFLLKDWSVLVVDYWSAGCTACSTICIFFGVVCSFPFLLQASTHLIYIMNHCWRSCGDRIVLWISCLYYTITPASGIILHGTCFANVCKWSLSLMLPLVTCNKTIYMLVLLLMYLLCYSLFAEIKENIMPYAIWLVYSTVIGHQHYA